MDKPRIEGKIPKWLCGSFVSNGPAQFEVGETAFNHWFDGFAMLKKFDFEQGKVRFQNRYIQSKEYVESNNLGSLIGNEFGTYASNSLPGRILTSIKGLIKGNHHDNCVVNTSCIDNNYIVMTEGNDLVAFDINDLSTKGPFNFTDNIPGHISTAHPHFDSKRGELINLAIEIGRFSKYHIYKTEPGSKTRQIIQTYVSDSLFYIHSFSISTNYIILFKSPLVINKYQLFLDLPFNNTLSYQEDLSSFFVIIDRRNGQIQEIETEPFVCLHSVNAYESGDEIIIDLMAYEGSNPYDDLCLANLRSDKPSLPSSEIRRYIIDLPTKGYKQISLSNKTHEFPRINYKRCNGNSYQYVYTTLITNPAGKFFNAIEKLNVQTGSMQRWDKMNYYVGEAVFVAKTNGKLEDEGVLLSIAFDVSTQLSSLLILDAVSMNLVAEVYLPLCLPFGLHGNFYKNTSVMV